MNSKDGCLSSESIYAVFLRNLPQKKKNLNFFFLADLKVTFFVQAQGYFIGDLSVCLI